MDKPCINIESDIGGRANSKRICYLCKFKTTKVDAGYIQMQ